MASDLVYLRDLDGTGSMHVCADGDDGAIAYAPIDTRPASEYAGLVERLGDEADQCRNDGADDIAALIDEAATALTDLTARNKALEAEVERLREAVTPSADTKAAYHGEFCFSKEIYCPDDDEYYEETVYVPWDTVKEIMTAISARALEAHP